MKTVAVRALSDKETELIHKTSIKVLETIGVNIEDEKIRAKLLSIGAGKGITNNRVLISQDMVTEALERCRREVVLDSVRGERYQLTPESRFYSSCCVDPVMVDYLDGKRPPRLSDCSDNARLIDGLDVISMPYKMDVDFSDVTGGKALLESNLAFMSNMSKHYICAPHDVTSARVWMEMSEIMAGGNLKQNTIVSALVSPISPLTLDKSFLDLLQILLPYGIMIILLPCPQAGATAPFSLAGTVVDFNAENLAAITVIQALYPGSAVCYHNVSQSFNVKAGLSSLGGPEKILGALAGAEMGRFYNLPGGSAGSATNSLEYDIQNGAETMAQLLLAVSGSANIVTGIGSLGNAMATSAEQILFDCELIALVEYLRKGIEVDEERLAFQAFQRVGPGGGFLEDELTLKLLRSGEHFLSGSFNLSPSEKKSVSMYERLHTRAQEIIKEHKPLVPGNRITELRKYVNSFMRNKKSNS